MKTVSGYYTRIVYYFYRMKIFHININLVKVRVIYWEMCGYSGRMSSNLSAVSVLEGRGWINRVRERERERLTWSDLLTFFLFVHGPWRGLYPVHSEFNNWILFHVNADAAAVIGKLTLVQLLDTLYQDCPFDVEDRSFCLLLTGSLWHKDNWLPCMESSY